MVAVLGDLLGIPMMIPLRRALIHDQDGILKYPEGTACAEVLKAGASEESQAASEIATTGEDSAAAKGGLIISIGFAVGFLYNTVMKVFAGWKENPEKLIGDTFRGGSISLENNPALLGVGYIIGPKIAGIMCAGGVLAVSAVYVKDTLEMFLAWSTAMNPFFDGPNSDWLAMLPFIALALFLYFVGRGALFNGKRPGVE